MSFNRNTKVWRGRHNRPPFQKGDEITPNCQYSYDNKQHRWPVGEYRTIIEVEYDDVKDGWVLAVFNPVVGRVSRYTPYNFTTHSVKPKENKMTEKTKFFAVRSHTTDTNLGICSDNTLSVDGIPADYHGDTTPLRDSRHQVAKDIADHIQADDVWYVVQIIARVEAEPPRPPMRTTEYR